MMRARMKRFGAAALSAMSLLMPASVFAEILPTIVRCGGDGPSCTVCDLARVANNVLNTGVFIAIFISATFFAWAGVLYLGSSTDWGKTSDTKAAKDLFGSVVVGLLLIITAWMIVDTVIRAVVDPQAPWGPWNEICTSR